jgi:hypothetical protein
MRLPLRSRIRVVWLRFEVRIASIDGRSPAK